jgi:GTP-binding protein
MHELEAFSKELIMKDKIVAISKCEMLDEELREAISQEMLGVDLHFFSSVTEQGLIELKDVLYRAIEANS